MDYAECHLFGTGGLDGGPQTQLAWRRIKGVEHRRTIFLQAKADLSDPAYDIPGVPGSGRFFWVGCDGSGRDSNRPGFVVSSTLTVLEIAN